MSELYIEQTDEQIMEELSDAPQETSEDSGNETATETATETEANAEDDDGHDGQSESENDSEEGEGDAAVDATAEDVDAGKSIEQQLKEERGRRARVQRQLKETKEKLEKTAGLDELKRQVIELREKLASDKVPKEETINYDDSPLDYLKQSIDDLKNQVSGMNQESQTQQEANSNQKYWNDVWAKGQKSAQQYSKENADFAGALAFLQDAELGKLKIRGYTEEESLNFVTQDVLKVLDEAFQADVNPSEVLFDMAKASGFRPTSVKAKSNNSIEKISKGLEKNKGLGSSGTTSKGYEGMSLDDLSNLPDDEFEEAWNKVMVKDMH